MLNNKVAILALCLLGGCATIALESHNKFIVTWESQLENYRHDYMAKEKVFKEQMKKDSDYFSVNKDKMTNQKDYWIKIYLGYSTETREQCKLLGRGQILSAFIEFMRQQPSPNMGDAWFERQVEAIKREGVQVDNNTKIFVDNFDKNIRADPSWLKKSEILALEQGILLGKIDEIGSIYRQAEFYYRDRQQARLADQQNAAMLSQALLFSSIYASQLNYQQQLTNSLNRAR